jgi:hypothetical protein
MPTEIAAKMGRTTATCPGYRGFASLWLTEPAGLSAGRPAKGFYVGANNPYMKDISVRVRRKSVGLNPDIALIRVADDSEGNEQYGANPAHICYEVMTNTDWGMGEDTASFNKDSFEACAATLFTEKFAMNMLWTRQSPIESFLKEVTDHIQASIDINPVTGLYEMRLLRGNYSTVDLLHITEDNARLTNFKAKSWSSVSNEMVVTWTNPETNKEETVTAQDPAAIAMQGGITSDSRNYYAIASRETALMAAERDLAMSAYPLPTCTAEVTREFWKAMTGDVVRLTWPKHGITNALFRVGSVTKGTSGRFVSLNMYEDVFSLTAVNYQSSIPTGGQSTGAAPQPLQFRKLGTLPAFMTVGALNLTDISELTYPNALAAVAAAADSIDDIGYELMVAATTATGAATLKSLGTQPIRTSWTISSVLPAEAVSTVDFESQFLGLVPKEDDFVMIGTGTDSSVEFGIVTATSGGQLTIARGVMDTTPKSWAIGTRVWIIPANAPTADKTKRSEGEVATYRLRTITSKGKLATEDAPALNVTVTDRPHLPLRPANVKVNTVGFGSVSVPSGNVTVTWSHRNRITESAQLMLWTGASMARETGQSTTVQLLDSSTRALFASYADQTGTSLTILRSVFGARTSAIVRVISERDGFVSLQGHEILINLS